MAAVVDVEKISKRSDLFSRNLDGCPEDSPDDDLTARGCRQATQVAVVFSVVRNERQEVKGRHGVGVFWIFDMLQSVHNILKGGIMRAADLEEKPKDSETIAVLQAIHDAAVTRLVRHDVNLHGVRHPVDSVFRPLTVVFSPVEMKLSYNVLVWKTAIADNGSFVHEVYLDCVSIVNNVPSMGVWLEALKRKRFQMVV